LGSINWSEILFENVHDDWQVKTTVQNSMVKYILIILFLKVTKLLLGGLKIFSTPKQLAFTKYKHSKSRSDYAGRYATQHNVVKYKIRCARKS